MQINGISFIMIDDEDGEREVHQYNQTEMAELFSIRDRMKMDRGEAVMVPAFGRQNYQLRCVDMIAASNRVAMEG